MKHTVMRVLVVALLGFFPQAALGADSAVIAFDGQGAANEPVGIWVMDQDGVNKTLVYEACPVNKDGVDAAVRDSRLKLCALVARELELGLGLLGIDTVEQM